jgi:hypothetical protein
VPELNSIYIGKGGIKIPMRRKKPRKNKGVVLPLRPMKMKYLTRCFPGESLKRNERKYAKTARNVSGNNWYMGQAPIAASEPFKVRLLVHPLLLQYLLRDFDKRV